MPNSEKLNIDIQTSTVFKVIFIILLFWILFLLRNILLLLLFAIMIASAIGPFADWLDRKHFPRILGVLLLYLTIFGLIFFLLSLVIPLLSGELSQLNGIVQQFVTTISGVLDKAQSTSGRYFDVLGEVQNLLDSASQYLQVLSQSVVGLVVGIFGGILSFFAVIVISFYLSVMRRGIDVFIKSIVPENYEAYLVNLWLRTEQKVGRWFQAQLLLALIVGLAVFVGLSLLNVKFPLLLGLLAMALELVPMVGPVMFAIPGIIIAFSQSPTLGLWTLILYVVIQQLESNVLVPLIFGKSLGINPVTVVIALLIGFQLAGILGMIVAVPVATILNEVIDDFAKKKESRRAVSST